MKASAEANSSSSSSNNSSDDGTNSDAGGADGDAQNKQGVCVAGEAQGVVERGRKEGGGEKLRGKRLSEGSGSEDYIAHFDFGEKDNSYNR